MISQALSMMADMYAAIGPGFFLALALPVLLLALVLVLRSGVRRIRS